MTPSTPRLKERMESLISEMVEKGVLWSEASAQFEKHFILKALSKNKGNLTRTSEMIGIHRNTLSKKLELYNR